VSLEFQTARNCVIDIETLSSGTIDDLVSYLVIERGLMDSTIHRHLKTLKMFLHKTYPSFNTKFIRYKSFNPEVIFLYESELKCLVNANLKGYMDKTRDLFVFSAVTGMRYSDSQRYEPNWLNDGLIVYHQKKTGSKAVVYLANAAKRIIRKYNNRPPHISSQKYNEYLKILFKSMQIDREVKITEQRGAKFSEAWYPLHMKITSHVARKTFITQLLIKGIPIQDVMSMSGHSDYKSMKPYIAIVQEHIKGMGDLWGF
jgi:site-specific recombinase XerD